MDVIPLSSLTILREPTHAQAHTQDPQWTWRVLVSNSFGETFPSPIALNISNAQGNDAKCNEPVIDLKPLKSQDSFTWNAAVNRLFFVGRHRGKKDRRRRVDRASLIKMKTRSLNWIRDCWWKMAPEMCRRLNVSKWKFPGRPRASAGCLLFPAGNSPLRNGRRPRL